MSRARLRNGLIAALLTLVLLELTLQAGAVLVWLTRPTTIAPHTEDRTLLCVGDSWTQGMGCSDPDVHSYPAVMERRLNEYAEARSQPPWTVINAGLAGSNSHDMLSRLPRQLADYRPRFVFILVGQNDHWSAPPRFAEGEAASHGFRWQLRTLRLARWMLGKLTDRGPGGAEPLPTGGAWARKEPEHPRPYPWPKTGWATNAETAAIKSEGWRAQARGDYATAVAHFGRVVEIEPDDPQARSSLISASVGAGMRQEALQHFEVLRALWEKAPSYHAGMGLLGALQSLGKYEEMLPIAEQMARDYPKSGPVWGFVARARFKTEDVPGALQAIDNAIELGDELHDHYWRWKFLVLLNRRDEALRSCIAAYRKFNDTAWLVTRLREDNVRYGEGETFARLVRNDEESTAEQKERMLRIAAYAYASGRESINEILLAHLEYAAAICRAAGAEPVFLTYPLGQRSYVAHKRAAQETDALFIDIATHFMPIIAARGWDSLRAPDGHCNDDGYAIMGRHVAEVFLHREKGP